jgi:hypothetical protein
MTAGQWGSDAWLHLQEAAGPSISVSVQSNTMQQSSASFASSDAQTITVPYDRLADAATRFLVAEDLPEIAKDCGEACAWLEACGYPGLKLLFEALDTTPAPERHPDLEPDSLGLDLHNVSCVFLAPRLRTMIQEHGRLFLRNVRHGLYLVPFSVWANIGVGCPVDPSFALGGERTKNPYEEKLQIARRSGIAVTQDAWQRMQSDLE